jgi:hypothetical protein
MRLLKHRNEKEVFAIDFTARLEAGETLDSVLALRVQKDGAVVSAQFGSPAGAINGPRVEFTLDDAAGAADQPAGIYVIYCEVATSAGEEMVETPELKVTDTGSIA